MSDVNEDTRLSWDYIKDNYQQSIYSSLTKRRINFLNNLSNLLIANQTINDDDKILGVIAKTLLNTYNYYSDHDSRLAVLQVLESYVKFDSNYLKIFIKYLNTLCLNNQFSLAITDYLTLLSWINKLNNAGFQLNLVNDEILTQLVLTQSLLLNSTITTSSNFKFSKHIRRVYDSTIASTKASISIALSSSSDDLIDTYISTLLNSTPHKSNLSIILNFAGVLSSSILDLQPIHPSFYNHLFENLNDSKLKILDYYTGHVLTAKVPPIPQSLDIFHQYFIHNFIVQDDFAIKLLPALEKSILRSSDYTFGSNLVISLFENLNQSKVNLSDILIGSKLLNHTFSGIKSSKPLVRLNASKTLIKIIDSLIVSMSSEDFNKLIDEILKNYKATSNSDIKFDLINLLKFLPKNLDVSLKICKDLNPIVSKDQNETSLTGLVNSFITHFLNIINNEAWNDTDVSSFENQIKTGLADKKTQLRKIWFLELGNQLFDFNSQISSRFANFLSSIHPVMLKSLDEAHVSPLPAITNKSIVCSYVTIALSPIFANVLEIDSKKVFVDSLIDSGDKFSILVSPKVITKLNEFESNWCTKSLVTSLNYIESLSSDDQLAYGLSWLYFNISTNIPYDQRLLSLKLIKRGFTQNPKILSNAIINATNKVLSDLDANSIDQDLFKYNLKLLSPIFSVITTKTNEQFEEIIEQNLSRLLVPSNHSQIPIKLEWIGLTQRSNVDVGKLVESNYDSFINEIYHNLNSSNTNGDVYKASLRSMSIISFIRPDLVGPKLSSLLSQDLKLDALNNLDSTSVQIWRASQNELVVDVLAENANGKKKQEDKNARDYETRKWEESLKKELDAKKKSIPKKLTKQEQALVNEQLAKEQEIRSNVQSSINHYYRAWLIIDDLAQSAAQVDNGVKFWFPVAILQTLSILNLDMTNEIFGSLPVNVYLKLSNLVSDRIGLLKPFVGSATIRLNNFKGLSENYLDEPILDLISRILFRIKILSDQRPLDSISLSYLLPLVVKVLDNGKKVAIKNSTKQAVTSEFVQEDPEEEQLMLAIEIISAHAEIFEDDSIPRTKILEVLIDLMNLPAKAKLAKECFLSLCQHIAVNINEQDLKLLLDNVVVSNVFIKTAILEGIDSEFDLSNDLSYSNEIWIAAHDPDTNCADLAITIWEDNSFKVADDALEQLLSFAGNNDAGLRLSIAKALISAARSLSSSNPDIYTSFLNKLIDLYHQKENPPAPKLDQFGLAIRTKVDQKDPWEERSTVALCLKLLSPHLTEGANIQTVFDFLVTEKALGDKEDLVRQELQDAGVEIIKDHGLEFMETLIPIFETCLGEKDDGTKKQDKIRECVIILYGALGRHLDAADERLKLIVERLLKTLNTPSEDVQFAISECIAPLVKSFSDRLEQHFDELFEKLFNGKTLAIRRGGAYGIAGLVKGAGIKSLSTYDVIRTLTDAADDKKNPGRREGVSFAFECLSLSLGKFFEPYVIEVLPIILKSLGDTVPEVREATDFAARQIMKNTTSFGVKKLIPLAISNLDEIQWRSKKGSVELLGSMAYLDPAQLSASLSTIVPEIVGVLNDTHKEVRKAADQALKRFGDVIRNPEIQAIVPALINAIGDPTKYTDEALDKLIKTQFVHYIDGPSLALIIHVIHRGMRDRSAATKRKACQIVGNMAILVDAKDLRPYLSQLVQELEVAMVDPVPATRSTAARALGSLVEKLGEDQFPDLIPRLLDTLQDENKSGDRLGSAQALSEVISGLGISKLDELLPVILTNATNSRTYIRAGFMPLLLFLPVCFGTQFSPYLSKIIPPILAGLADVDEEIRDTSLRAGRLIVKNYAKKAVDLLLPELEAGLSDSNYRIRLSSVELTGDLLFQVTGISGKNELVEEQAEYSGEVNKSLLEVLGQERRDRVLAALFVCRSDVTGIVRSAAVDIWKALVANTPRTVKEILPTLTTIIVRRLASPDEVHRTIAASTLGEMVRRVGANALAQLLPTLEESLVTGDSDTKQGICIALTELIKSASNDAMNEYSHVFIRIVRDALIDSSPRVREAAAQGFEALQEILGKVVIDEILPHLLNLLESSSRETSENALSALQDIMATKSEVIFPILIPTLLTPPIDAFKAKALSSLASVAGSALYRRLSTIINTLVLAVIEARNESEEYQQQIKDSFDQILLAIDDNAGVNPLMQQLLSLVKHEDSAKRAIVYERLGNFFSNTTLDYSIYTQDMIGQFILSLGDKSPQVVQGTFDALTALVKNQSKESLERLVKPARQALILTGVKGEELAGFKLPKGPNCILPIFLHGLMYGNNEQREASALSIADIIDKTPSANLRPFATTITGPLIRVIGEKVSSDIKAAILIALTNLLLKIPQFLRPFVPQLQRTFVRSLSDANNETLREKAVIALGVLIEFQPRVDSLVTELVTGAKNTDDSGVKMTMLKGMLEVVSKAGNNMNETSKNSIMTLVEEEITKVSDEKTAVSYARLIGSLLKILSSDEAKNILNDKVLINANSGDIQKLKFSILSINSFLKDSPQHIFQTDLLQGIIDFIISGSNSRFDYISDNATIAIGKLFLQLEKKPEYTIDEELRIELIKQLSITMIKPESNSSDTRRLSLVVIRTLARYQYEKLIKPNWTFIVPSVFTCLRDAVIPIRLAAEKAYLAIFNLIEDTELKDFNQYFSDNTNITTVIGGAIQPRSIGDYTKRVANRLASVERERIEAGGDDETLFSDRIEDEQEVWAVGGVDLNNH